MSSSLTNTHLKENWNTIQDKLADIPGKEGIEKRRNAYQPYFLRFGRDIMIEEGCRFYYPERISLDDDVRINIGGLIYGSGGVHIGRHVRIGPRCFLHSANHDIAFDDKAFFEKGYIYENVHIGDNCLISANVSIMPGTKLGSGSFVACGAVVTKNSYCSNSYLAGIPARQLDNQHKTTKDRLIQEEQPVIALLTPEKNSTYLAIARLLITVLGCPQVRAYQDKSSIPESVEVSIALGPEGWKPCKHRGDLWSLYYSKEFISGRVLMNGVELPESLEWSLAPKVDPTLPDLHNAFQVSAYYSLKRLSKIESKGNEKEHVDIIVFYWLQKKYKLMPEKNFQLYEDALKQNAFYKEFIYKSQDKVKQEIKSLQSNLSKYASIKGIPPKVFLNEPHKLVLLNTKIIELDELESLFSELLIKSNKALQLIYLGLAASIHGFNNIYNMVIEKVIGQFYDQDSGCILNLPNTKSFNYSPITVLFLSLHGSCPQINNLKKRAVFKWGILPAGKENNYQVRSESNEGFLFDKRLQLISSSLVDNWVKLNCPPDLEGFPLELQQQNYYLLLKQVEELWVKLFRDILLQRKMPFVQLKPWPYGYRNALSLRYDVDRNTIKDHVLEIVEIQKEMLNGNCASWFLIPGSAYNRRLQKLLPLYLQEIGLHAVGRAELKPGLGATFHSSPGAEYWCGALTVGAVNEAKSLYSEMLSTQLTVPRPVLLKDKDGLHSTDTWFLPVHFPLEGSTGDTSTAYFDRFFENCKSLIAAGGHLILSSHPDLNQDILKEIILRDQFNKSWCVTIEAAVKRCKEVFQYGSIGVTSFTDKSISLISANTIADLQVSVFWPDYSGEEYCMQLNEGMPRTIERQIFVG